MSNQSFPVCPSWFQYFRDFMLEKHFASLKPWPKLFMCLLDDADEAPLANIKTERQRWQTKPTKIRVVRNPACCCGDETGTLMENIYKNITAKNQSVLIQIAWDIFLRHSWSKFVWVYDVIMMLICIMQKLEYLWHKERYLKTAFFFSHRLIGYVLKWLYTGKMWISS